MEPKLFTPGPLTTSRSVKEAMVVDLGSRERAFLDVVRDVRERLLQLGGVSKEAGFEAVLMQGSGTFGVEAVISSAIPRAGKLLALVNGVYGERIAAIARVHGVEVEVLRTDFEDPPTPGGVAARLAVDRAISHVAAVHCETTSGILNPVVEIGAVVKAAGRMYVIDAMSSFGGIPLSMIDAGADFLISSSNKCIEGVPGFSFVLARRAAMVAAAGQARTVSLDLHAQWEGLEKTGQFRFTPPTHVIVAFQQALDELDQEGGVEGRSRRYADNQACLAEGMRRLGFRCVLPAAVQSPIITTYHEPNDPAFSFDAFHDALLARGCAIYPGRLADRRAFRVGSVGRLFRSDMNELLAAVDAVVSAMGFDPAA